MAGYVPRKGTSSPSPSIRSRVTSNEGGDRLVVSNDLFNKHTGICIVCPVTSTKRDYPFHVAIPEGEGITGFVMVEQIKSVDFRSRQAKRIGRAPAGVLDDALSLLDASIY